MTSNVRVQWNGDFAIGQKIRQRRLSLGMSQIRLGDSSGVSFYQIQRFERGIDKIESEPLAKIAAALGVKIEEFL